MCTPKRRIRITKEVAKRVRKGSFKWNDDCIICGQPFQRCDHNVDQTQAVISAVRANPDLWR